ncbi:MAG TPA: hypothetical protein VK501_19450 [Baekduia sp.]|uniref:hypothetical protein n=1 Tax=Baekduia sp. TaxID=2600305 RepID=UPI002BA52A54|nr:hypothetical protein [Baekduia sp.]HMJ36089.1 hypothetical protein [Baekduia sp.]
MTDDLLADAVAAARNAAILALAEVLDAEPGPPREVRLMLCATTGDPSAGVSQTEVRFAGPSDVAISHHDKVAMALASMKAIAPDLYDTMMAGIERGRGLTLAGVWARLRPSSR